MLPVQVEAQLEKGVGVCGFQHAPHHVFSALGHHVAEGEEVPGLLLGDLAPGIGHVDGQLVLISLRLHRQPLEHQVLPALGLILVPGEGAVVVEGDGAGAVGIHGLLALHFSVFVIGQDELAAALIGNAEGLGVQLAGNEPAGGLPGAAAPIDGDHGLVLVPALHQGMGSSALVLAHKVHHGVLPVGVLLEHGNEVRALVQHHGDLRLGGELLAILQPLLEHAARLGPGSKGIGVRLRQVDLGALIGVLLVDLRGLRADGIGDAAPALGVDGHDDRGLGQLGRQEMEALAALHLQQQAVLAFLGDGDHDGLRALIHTFQLAVQAAALLGQGSAGHDLVQHHAHVPARLVHFVHPQHGEHVPIFCGKVTRAAPFLHFSLLGALLLPAGAKAQQQHCRHQHAKQFFHFVLLIITEGFPPLIFVKTGPGSCPDRSPPVPAAAAPASSCNTAETPGSERSPGSGPLS